MAAESMVYNRKDTVGGTVISARGVRVTEETITAEQVTWSTSYPFMSVSLSVEKYSQKREKKAEEKP